jgi:hypothetical protein
MSVNHHLITPTGYVVVSMTIVGNSEQQKKQPSIDGIRKTENENKRLPRKLPCQHLQRHPAD